MTLLCPTLDIASLSYADHYLAQLDDTPDQEGLGFPFLTTLKEECGLDIKQWVITNTVQKTQPQLPYTLCLTQHDLTLYEQNNHGLQCVRYVFLTESITCDGQEMCTVYTHFFKERLSCIVHELSVGKASILVQKS